MVDPAVLILNKKRIGSDVAVGIHSVPCKIGHTGPAKVEAYLLKEEQRGGNVKTTFRGRFLDGTGMEIPCGYKLFTLKERGHGGGKQIYDVERCTDRFTLWEYDKLPSSSNPLPRAINFLKVAEHLASD